MTETTLQRIVLIVLTLLVIAGGWAYQTPPLADCPGVMPDEDKLCPIFCEKYGGEQKHEKVVSGTCYCSHPQYTFYTEVVDLRAAWRTKDALRQ